MPDTGERREITRFANAKEAETVQESKKLISKTRQRSAKAEQENRFRKGRNVSSSGAKKPGKIENQRDQESSQRMVDEGDPNPR